MHGIGNDFVMIDGVELFLGGLDLAALSRSMCDRRFGVGADGIIIAERSEAAPYRMRMLNPDGSESEMCGNGVRCFAKFLRDKGYNSEPEVAVETGAGVLQLHIEEDGQVRVDMGLARLTRGEIGMERPATETFIDQPIEFLDQERRGTAVSMGNPHIVLFVEDVAAIALAEWGRALEHHPLFPARVNAHFVQRVDESHLIQRTWERGAGATLACGTGACACAVAAALTGRAGRDVEIELPGGKLRIEYLQDGRVMMTGPAETSFEGVWP
jgi:diaminopimelate epimerase